MWLRLLLACLLAVCMCLLLACRRRSLTAARRSPYNFMSGLHRPALTTTTTTCTTTQTSPCFHSCLPTYSHSRPVAVGLCFCLAHHKYRSLFSSSSLPCPAPRLLLLVPGFALRPLTHLLFPQHTCSYFLFSSSYARCLHVTESHADHRDARAASMADTNGRQASEAPSSSSSDLYAAHTAEPADLQPSATNRATLPPKPAQIQAAPPVYEDDGDCSSEMDVSDASSSVAPAHILSGPAHAGAKRKLSDAGLMDASPASVAQDIVKKPRMSLPIAKPGPSLLMTAGWPPEIWQQVFTHLSPAMLSRCLRVCRSFKFCLTQLKAPTVPRKKNTPLARVLESEALWTQARKHAYPTMPRPLVGFSELQMLQLVGGTLCQSCGKPHGKSPVTNVFNAGPGESGVRVIWPFRVRLCGNCFVNESLTVRAHAVLAL